MYNITDADVEFKELLQNKLKEFESQYEKTFFTLEATLQLIHEAVQHTDFNNFKNNKVIWNAACFINIVSFDLKMIARGLTFSVKEWEKRYFARQAALLIYESCDDIFQLFGKDFKSVVKRLSDSEYFLLQLKSITKQLNEYNAAYKKRIHEIRNISIAHREKNTIQQLDIIYSISWVESINFISAFDKILNQCGAFLQMVMDKSVREFEELNG